MYSIKSKFSLILMFLLSFILVNQLFTFRLGDSDTKKMLWVEHTHRVIALTEDFLSSLKDMETGQRGYLLANDIHYLAPFYSGFSSAQQSYETLLSITSDNLKQQARLVEIDKHMQLKIKELRLTIEIFSKGKHKEAITIVKSGDGKVHMDKIRTILQAFVEEEQDLLLHRKSDLKKSSENNIILIRIMIFTFLLVVFYFIYRFLNEKEFLKNTVNQKIEEISIVNEELNTLNNNLEESVKERTKELEEANIIAIATSKSKSEFLANMSHEIRTPLNAILGFIDLLKSRINDKVSSEYLYIVSESSISLLHIIEDILDFSKIESGKLAIEKINFHPEEEFRIIAHLFDAKCSEKAITLNLNMDDSLPKYLNSDPLRIKQVISNLISNAVKFTPSDKNIWIDLSYKNGQLHVSVKDEGIGIAKDKQEAIFSAFSQEDSSTTRNYGGTGLGLTISKQLVNLLGGELNLKSELDIGSEFYFSIPAIIADYSDVDMPDEEVYALSGKVLLVEDNKTNQLLGTLLLTELGFTNEIANDGLEAVEKFTTNSYDLILMDENMPRMSGTQATIEILKIEKEKGLKHTPIIALTANALKGDREKFLNAGMDEYLTKPLNKNQLGKIMSKMLKPKESN